MEPITALNLVFIAHFLFVLFATLGGFFMLYHSRAAFFHLPALVWGIWIEVSHGSCPLTSLENEYRELANLKMMEGDWLVHQLEKILYPPSLTSQIQLTLAGFLITINLAAYGLWYFKKVRPDRATVQVLLIFVSSISFLAFCSFMLLDNQPQPKGYHIFADKLPWLGVDNGLNVLSNLAIFGAGLWGWLRLKKGHGLALRTIFIATMLTGIGSAYYHLDPDNYRLVYDRLGMSFTFACFLTLVVADRFGKQIERSSLVIVSMLFMGATLFWYLSESGKHANFYPYVFIQAWPMLLIPYLLWLRGGSKQKAKVFLQTLGVYVVAFTFDQLDKQIYKLLQSIISGHTLKHLVAGFAVVVIVLKMHLWQEPENGVIAEPAAEEA